MPAPAPAQPGPPSPSPAAPGGPAAPDAWSHRVLTANGVRLHVVVAGRGDPVVLLHGFPQSWAEWRQVIPHLVHAGRTVIAPDLRGAGGSERPLAGYEKAVMAADVRELVRALGHSRIDLVGHDIGMMVAYAYAARWPNEVRRLVLTEALLPGLGGWDRFRADPRAWHFAFHGQPDVPEMLVAGREREYLAAFMAPHAVDADAALAELDAYARAFAAPGGARAQFSYYRAFAADARDNAALAARGKLPTPALWIGGEASLGDAFLPTLREIAADASGVVIPDSGHWIPEERPDAFAEAVLRFLSAGERAK